mmetsp:Transcript_19332/g.40537  ORF Transcript_19332/g.40537 Transcript_19332/m.40537 type:complete len:332 (-) Transcript_19332:260-1255(-)
MQTQSLASALLQKFALLHHQPPALTIRPPIRLGRSHEKSEERGSHDGREGGRVKPRTELLPIVFGTQIGHDAGHEYAVEGGQHRSHQSSQRILDHGVLRLRVIGVRHPLRKLLRHVLPALGEQSFDAGNGAAHPPGVFGDEVAEYGEEELVEGGFVVGHGFEVAVCHEGLAIFSHDGACCCRCRCSRRFVNVDCRCRCNIHRHILHIGQIAPRNARWTQKLGRLDVRVVIRFQQFDQQMVPSEFVRSSSQRERRGFGRGVVDRIACQHDIFHGHFLVGLGEVIVYQGGALCEFLHFGCDFIEYIVVVFIGEGRLQSGCRPAAWEEAMLLER